MNASAVVPNAATAKLMTPLARYTSTMPAPSTAYASPCTMPLSSICWLTSQPCSVITTHLDRGVGPRVPAEEDGARQLLVGGEVGGRAVEADGALLDEHHTVGEPRATASDCSTTTIACPASRSAPSDVEQPLHHERREAERELVDQQQARLEQERAPERDHLLLTARERRRVLLPVRGQRGEHVVDPGDAAGRVAPARRDARPARRGGSRRR